MKRLPLVLLLLIVAAAALGAQPRTLVPIVRPVLHEKTSAFLVELADTMDGEGYADAADYLRAWAKSGFGSGFVYVDARDGRNFVITNKHVVDQAESVVLEFEREDGSTVSYKNCPILAVSESLDLALVGFPDGAKPFARGFIFSSSLPVDGTDVWSAGYPGLLSRPSWQFGKGSVTNAMARIPELADPALVQLIQHSAPIDPGSSGGPLLASDSKATLGYAVSGINTWKVGGRQDVNFAIPAKAIISFLGTATKTTTLEPRVELAARADAFALAANRGLDGYKALARYISYDFVASSGERFLRESLESAPSEVRDEIIAVFVGVSPVEGLKLSIAYAIAQNAAAGEAARLSVDGVVSLGDDSGGVGMHAGTKPFEAPWVREHGFWRLAAFPPLDSKSAGEAKAKKTGTGGIEIWSPYDVGLSFGAALELGGYETKALTFGMHLDLFNSFYVMSFMDMSLLSYKYVSTDYFEPGEKTAIALSPIFGAMLQLPLRKDDFYLVPYAKGGFGLLLSPNLDAPLNGGLLALGGGLHARLPGSSWSFGLEYLRKSYASIDSAVYGDESKSALHTIGAYGTFGSY